EVTAPEDARPLELDGARIQQAVRNLARNAIDATPAGGIVKFGLELRDDEVLLTVEDAGPGIPLEAMARVGTPFFTTKPHGTGLGLAISRKVAEAHGGRLEIGNRAEGGACARVLIPTRRPASPQ